MYLAVWLHVNKCGSEKLGIHGRWYFFFFNGKKSGFLKDVGFKKFHRELNWRLL